MPEALVILRNASTTEEGEFGWPAPRKDAADWLLEETSRNIKTTSYGKDINYNNVELFITMVKIRILNKHLHTNKRLDHDTDYITFMMF